VHTHILKPWTNKEREKSIVVRFCLVTLCRHFMSVVFYDFVIFISFLVPLYSWRLKKKRKGMNDFITIQAKYL